jgi:acetyltransferase-like isoleucine patch superfamily enzyme
VILEHDWFPRPLPANVEVGERSWVYSSFAFVHCAGRKPVCVRIGRDTGVYAGSFFELGPDGEVEIGDFCTIVGAIVSTNGRVTIGDYTFVAHEVVIADSADARPGPVGPGKEIVVGENVWIGARAVLLGGAHLGEGSVVGAAAVVDFAVPPYAIVAGNPARLVGTVRR